MGRGGNDRVEVEASGGGGRGMSAAELAWRAKKTPSTRISLSDTEENPTLSSQQKGNVLYSFATLHVFFIEMF